MAKLLKRLGSLALAIIMVASLLPMNVFAETAAEPAAVTVPEGFTGVGTPEELTAAVAKGGKIALTADITLTSKLTVSNTTTFDWNGFTLTLTEKPTETNGTSTYSMYINGGTIVFKDSSAAGDGGLSITGAKNYVQGVRVGGGTLQVDSGKYYLQGNSSSGMLLFYTWRKTTFNGGTIEAVNNGSGSASAVYAADNSNTAVTINGGTFNATCNSGSPYAINVASSTSTKYVNFPDSGKTVTVNAKGAGSVYGIYNGATMSIDNPKLTVNAECTYTGTSSRYVRPLYNGRNINVTAGNFNGTETGSSTTVYVYGMANGRITKTEKVDGVDTTVEVCQGYGTVSGGTFTATAPQRTYGINMDYADPEKGFTVTGNAVVTAGTAALQPWRGTVNITGGTYYANTPFSKNDECTLTVTGGQFKSADQRSMVEVKTYLDETYAQDSDGTVKLKTELTPWITVDDTGYYWIEDGVAAIKEDGTSVVKLNRDYIYRRASAHIIRAAAAEFDLGGHTWHNCNTSGNALTFEPKDGKTNTHTYLKNGTVISDSNVAIRMTYGTFKLENVTAQAFVGLGYYETDAVTYDQKKNVVTNCVLLSSPTVNGYPFSFHLSSTTSKQENVAVYFDNSVLVNVSATGGAIFRSNSKYGFKGSVYLGENVHMYGGRNQWSSIQAAETGYTAGSLSIYDQNGTKLNLGTFTQSGCLGSNTWTYGDYSKLYLKVTTHGDEIVIPAVPHNCTEDGLLAGAKCAVCGYVTKEQVTDPAAHDTIVKKDGKAPTCVEAGWKDYYQCSICGKYFTDSLGENEIGNETQLEGWKEGDGAIQATGEHTAVHTAAVAPKCTEDGNIEYWQCSVCKKYFSDEACETEIVLAQTVVPQLGHQFGTDGKCTNPGCDEEACKEGHTWGEKVEAQEANCAQGGWAAHYICSACGAYGTDAQTPEVVAYETLLIDVQPDKHTNLVGTPKKDATVYVTGHEAYWTCEGCHKLYADEAAANEISAPVVLPQLTAVAQIGEVDKFATLQEAANASKNGDVIVMLENYTLSASVAFPYGTTRVLDLNGKTINAGAYCLVNAGNLTIKDSATGGKITGTGILIENKLGQGQTVPGNLTIENGTYITSGKKVLNISGGTVVVKNGELAIETTGHGEYHVIEVGSKASLTVDGGKLWIKENTTEKGNSSVATCYDVVHNFGTTVINNGSFEATRNGLCVGSGTTQVRAITPDGGTTTINGGTFKGTKANSTNASHVYAIRSSTSTAVVNINGGTFNSLNIGFIANINKGTFSGSHFINSNGHVTVNGGQFNTGGAYYAFNSPENVKDCKNAWIKVNSMNIVTTTSTQAAVAKTGSVVADYVTIDSVAVIKNGTKKLSYASTVNEIVAAVNTIGSDGNAVVTLLKDVTDNDVNSFTTSFELDMNGKTWVQTTGSAVSVGTAGTAKQVTYIHDGYIYDKGSVAVSISAGAMHLDNVDVYCTSAMPVAYYVRNGNFNAQNLIENSALVTNRYHAFSFRSENKDAEEDRQPGVGMTFRNTDLINIYNTTSADGNIFFAGEKLTTGTYTLGEGVNMYTIYSGSYNTADQKSVVVTEEGVVIHDQLAAKQYPELTAILTPIGEAMGFKEGDIVYGSGTSAAKFTYNPSVYKWTTNHTNEYVSDGNATCTENATTTEKCTATVNGEVCGVETGNKGVAENTATGHTYGEPAFTWDGYTAATATFECACGDKQTVTAEISDEITNVPTCEGEGLKTYTATVKFGNKDYTDSKTETLSATGHNYGEPTFVWAEDNTAKAVFTCACEHKHEVEATVTSETTAATCVATGKTVYTAKVTLDKNEYSETKEVTLEKDKTNHTGAEEWTKTADKHSKAWNCCGTVTVTEAAHTWKNGKCEICEYGCEHPAYGTPTFTWAETKASATATFTCACGDTKVENCVITSKINTPATCEGKGEKTFTATVTFNGVTYTDDVKVEIPAKGHDFENGTVTETFAGNCQTESFVTTKCARCDVTNTVKGEKNPAVHTNLVKDDAVAATCTATGLTEGEHCEACGTVTKKQETVDALNHKFENYTDNGDGTHTGVCANDASHKDTAAHTFADGTCDKCGAAEKINVAEVDGTGYATLAEAIAAADGKTVKLLTDLEIVGETITIADGKKVTLDMNGKKITVTDNKTSNYELFYIYGELTVTGNGTIELTSTTNRNWNAMSAIFHNRGGELTIENGTYRNLGGTDMAWVVDNSGNYYGDATTNINGGELTSTYTAIRNRMEQNSHGASGKATVNVTGGTINGTTSAIWAQAASESTTAPATGEINVSGGTVGLINTARSAGAVSMTTITGGTVAGFKGEVGELTVKGGELTGTVTILTADGQATDYEITEEGLYAPASSVAEVDGTGYATLAAAIAAADGKTVKLLKDIKLTETITIAAGKTITLDLNGKTLVYESTIQGEAMITNKGNLTINDTVGGGVINYNYIGAADPSYGKGNYTISNGGNLTVNGGKITIADLRSHAKYPIDNNSTTGNAVLTINGGHLYNYNTCAIRQFCNSTAYSNIVTINGGLIEGFSAIWMQNPGKNTVNGKLTITGGEIKTTAKAYVNGTSALKDVASKIYCTTEGGAWTADSAVAITGGIINENVYLAEAAPESITIGDATFNGYVQLPGLKGSGTEADPYQIGSVEELILFRDSVNAGEGKYNGAYVKLVADIDLAGINWEPIGNVSYNSKYAPADETKIFSGTFDGNGKVISNLSVTKIMNGGADKDANVGLFGITGEGATIKNLTLTNVTINTDGRNVGALAGVTYMATLDNITVNGNIQIKGGNNVSAVGGMTRYSNVSATNITVVGDDGSSIVGNNIVGGIFAEIAPKSGCTFSDLTVENVAISGVGGVGGIVGLLTTGTVENVSVKDVALTGKTEYQGNTMGRIRLGSVAGLMGGQFATIANATVENVTAKNLDGDAVVLPVIGANYDASSNATEAKIGNTYYATFAKAYAAAKAGDTVELLQPIVVAKGQTLTLDKDVTIAYSSSKQGHEAMITNNGTLVVDGTTIVFTYTGAGDPNHGWGSYTIYNTGDLTVNSGTVKFEGTQTFGTHCSLAIFQYSGSATINGGDIINNAYRSLRLWKGDVTINGGNFQGQTWVHCVDDSAKLTITGGTFAPAKNGGDGSSVFVNNSGKKAELAVTGGTFATKIGANDVAALAGAITGGKFTEAAKNGTNAALYEGMVFGNADADGYYTLEKGLKGKGTEADPYQIGSLNELILFRDSVNAGETKYNAAGVYVVLTADIDLASVANWEPIGTWDYTFMGNFNGNGKTVSNLTITGTEYLGLFGITEGTKDAENVVENLVIENVTVTGTGDIVAAAIAYPYYTTVKDITVCGDIAIEGRNYVAGVLGYTRHCDNASNLTVSGNDGSYIKGNITVGGVIADIQLNNGLVGNYSNFSVSNVAVTGTKAVGAISGIIGGQTVDGITVENVEGAIFGTLGNPATIKNVTTNGTGALIGAGYGTGKPVQAQIGDTYYQTLDSALEKAEDGDEIILLTTYVVEAGQTVELDLTGKTITMVTDDKSQYCMILNKGDLTITGEGKLSYNYTGTDASGSDAFNTIESAPGSVLTVKGGEIENLTANCLISYAIDGLTNGGNGDVTINIEGGKISSKKIAVRIFANSTTNTGTLNISGGEISGRVIIQNASAKANKATLTITGGTFNTNGYKTDVLYVGGSNGASGDITASVSGGTFNGEILSAIDAGFVSGGTFDRAFDETFCAEGFVLVENADGTYGVIQGLKGKGTEADPYQIGTLEELILFRDSVNAGETRYNAPGVYVALTADIDMAGIDWSVNIGDDCNVTFDGIFDGNGKTISNLTAIETAQKADGYVCTGLFGAIAGKAVIKNLTIANATIDTGDFTGNNASVVVGFAWAATGSIENVKVVDATINANKIDGTGAIVGYAYSSTLKVTDCTVENTTVNGQAYVGGVIGYAGGKVTLNGNTVTGTTVNATSCAAGGVAGIIQSGSAADNTVNDIVLTSAHENWKNAVGVVVGTYTGNSVTVSGTITNSTAAIVGVKHADKPTAPLAKTEAKIGDTYYATFADAYKAAKAGETVTLLTDLTASDIIVINKAITLDGNGHKLTSTAGRAINVDGADGATIKNLTIDAKGERAINVIGGATNVTIDNVTATAANYTVNLAGSAANAVVAIKNSNLTGLNTVNVAAAGAKVTVVDSTVNCNDNNTTAGEAYAALCLNKDAVGASIIATGTTVNVTEGSDSEKGRNGAEDGTVTINGSTEGVTVTVAVITYEGSDYYYGFTSIEDAIAFAEAGQTITLIRDVTAKDIIVIDKAITLDGNGKTLTSTATRAINIDCADKVLIKDLTIATTANTERAINVIQKAADLTLENVTAEGFKYTLNVASSSVGSDITVNGGKLSGYAAINIAGNSTTVTVNDAELIGVNNVPAHESNAFAVINVDVADGAVVTVKGGSLTAISTTGNRQFAVGAAYATNAKVTVDAELNLVNGDVFNGKVEQIAASFRAEYADELLAQGYMTETSATAGLVDVAGFAAASVNGVGYTELQDAIDAAEALGEATVVVLNNQDLTSHIIISDGITLDLNGKTVKTTRYFTVYGDVVDGTAGGEGIVIAAKTHVMGQKSFMSIYDSAAGGYRFYAFEVVSAGTKKGDSDTSVKFGIKLNFANTEAYTLIANGDTKLELHALITWTGLAAPMDYTFSDATVKSYASLVAADLANSGSTKKAITLTFTGVEVLGEDGQINVTPVLESETSISGAAATINWKANS